MSLEKTTKGFLLIEVQFENFSDDFLRLKAVRPANDLYLEGDDVRSYYIGLRPNMCKMVPVGRSI